MNLKAPQLAQKKGPLTSIHRHVAPARTVHCDGRARGRVRARVFGPIHARAARGTGGRLARAREAAGAVHGPLAAKRWSDQRAHRATLTSGVVKNVVTLSHLISHPLPASRCLDARKAHNCGICEREPAAGVYRSLRKNSLPSTRAHRAAQWTFIGTVQLMLTMLGEHVRRHDADHFYRRIWGISTSAFCHNPPRGRVVVLNVYG